MTPAKKQTSSTIKKNSKKTWNTSIIPHKILKTLEAIPNKNLFYYFTEGGMENYTGREILNLIKKSSHALRSLGVKPGNHVGIMLKSSPMWICFEQAILSTGAISVGLFQKSSFEYLNVQLNETEAKIIFVDNEESSEKLTAFQKKFKIVILKDDLYTKVKANKNFTTPRILSWSQFLKLGNKSEPQSTKNFEKHILDLKENQTAVTIYTTSTQEQPKGAVFTHQQFNFQLNSLKEIYPINPEMDRGLSILPLSHILERLTVYYAIASSTPICFVEEPQNLLKAIKHFRPTVMTVVPQLLERIYKKIQNQTPQIFLIKHLYKSALKNAETKEPRTPATWKDLLFKKLFYNTFYQALGGKFRFIVSSGATLKPHLLRFFYSINIPIYEGYGLTEACATVCCNNHSHFKPYSVGKIIPHVKTKISSNGELLIHSPSLMSGYLKNPKLTKNALKKDAKGKVWFATGDKAKIQNGYVFLEGHIKDFFKVSSGHYVYPLQIEQALEKHHLIKNAIVLGEKRPFISVLIFIDILNIKKNTDNFNDFEKIMQIQIKNWVGVVNAKLNPWERLEKFKIIWRTFSFTNDSTPSKSELLRNKVEEKFKKEINEMYTSP